MRAPCTALGARARNSGLGLLPVALRGAPPARSLMPPHDEAAPSGRGGGDQQQQQQQQQRQQQQAPTPAEAARSFVGPALREMELRAGSRGSPLPTGGGAPSDVVLERWRLAYLEMVDDAVRLGIPRSVIPMPPPGCGLDELRRAKEHLEGMTASFMSANI